jgi:transcriptional regulator with XRE-family HTH domain
MMPVNPYKARNQAWIQQICDETGLKFTELARRAGVDPATLTRFMNNPRYKPNLSDTTLQKIAASMNRPVPTPTTTLSLPSVIGLRTVKVIGTAAAGLWKEVAITAEDYYGLEDIPVVENPRYAGREQYALLVEGNSVNRVILDGDYAICVSWAELGVAPATGQYVHVERSRGGLQEVTIKKILVANGTVQLWPDSTDARFQSPVELNGTEEDTEVTIRGLVIGSYRRFG